MTCVAFEEKAEMLAIEELSSQSRSSFSHESEKSWAIAAERFRYCCGRLHKFMKIR